MATIQHIAGFKDSDHDHSLDWESSDARVDELLREGDIEPAQVELARTLLESLDSGAPIVMTTEKWEDLRLELHREAKIAS